MTLLLLRFVNFSLESTDFTFLGSCFFEDLVDFIDFYDLWERGPESLLFGTIIFVEGFVLC